MDFGTFPHLTDLLMCAAEQQLCPLKGRGCRYTGRMLWYEFRPYFSILLPQAMDFGTFLYLAD
jgi:hypothetical protein